MLVKDLRKTIDNYNNDDKTKIIVELYKRIPKKVKEEYDIDEFILNVKNSNKIVKEEKTVTFEELEREINYFISCVNNDLYACPNKVIDKSERSKWRFKVKRYIKELVKITPNSKEGEKATDLLKNIFTILSIGSVTLKFSNWETFRAVQISQADFLKMIMMRKLECGISTENIIYCLDMLDIEYDPYEYHRSLLFAFKSCLNMDYTRKIAIEILKNMVLKKQEELKKRRERLYDCEERIRYFVECIIFIYFDLGDIDNGIEYYHKNYIEVTAEVKEYILLKIIEMYELDDEWIKEYEAHNIDYRDSLKEKYIELKNK